METVIINCITMHIIYARLCSYGLSKCDSLARIWRQDSGGKRQECVTSLKTCERLQFPVLFLATVMRNSKIAPNKAHWRCQFLCIEHKKNKKREDRKKREWQSSCMAALGRVRVTTVAVENQNTLCVYCWASSLSAIQDYWMLHKNAFV
jgi:hypothetical protein